MRAMRFVLLIAVLGCSSPPLPPATPPATRPIVAAAPRRATELSPALAPLAWWLGDWEGNHGSEHWHAAAGAFYGVALPEGGGFEVMIVDDADGPGAADDILRFIAMPGGAPAVEFRKRELSDKSVTFANDAHDYPKTISYEREGARLRAVVAGGSRSERFAFRRREAAPASELEAADRAFATDTAARGLDGWVAAFENKGAMMRKGARVEGKTAIADLMRDLLASGKLVRNPITSGRRGDIGYTVGKANFTGTNPDDKWRSSYVTIWRKQADATWKVWFDVGRMVND